MKINIKILILNNLLALPIMGSAPTLIQSECNNLPMIETKNNDLSCLLIATQTNNISLVQSILSKLEHLDRQEEFKNVHIEKALENTDQNGNNALNIAQKNKSEQMIFVLIKHYSTWLYPNSLAKRQEICLE